LLFNSVEGAKAIVESPVQIAKAYQAIIEKKDNLVPEKDE
jgi:hypothetical protein